MPGPVHVRSDRAGLRPCKHAHAARLVTARSDGCPECLARGEGWVELWLCLSCGWVACSDGSPNRHAQAHYEETDHPLATPLRPGPSRHWCFIHQRLT
ncbi:MAG: UBP-type zinc finger domain-containing protein [Frankiaceae bacterium]